MVVVDSSALIPLARVGRPGLIPATFETVRVKEAVREEVLVEGERGTSALSRLVEDATVAETPDGTDELATLEGIAAGDAAVVLLADRREESLLANDKGLIEVARSHGVDTWWVTTLLLACLRDGTLDGEEGVDVLYDLVNEGMNLHPQVYTKVQRKLREIGEDHPVR